jgi:RNA polymerase sigma factor (sigma-70 family)
VDSLARFGPHEHPLSPTPGHKRERPEERFQELFAATLPALLVWAELRLRPPMRPFITPEDLIAQAWARALAVWPFEPEEFRKRILKIASYVLLEAFSAIRMQAFFDGGSPRPTKIVQPNGISPHIARCTQIYMSKDSTRELLARIEELDDHQRHLLLNRGLEGWPFEEIAARLDRSVGEVERIWEETREELRRDGTDRALGI